MRSPNAILVTDLHAVLARDPLIVDVREAWEVQRASLRGVKVHHYPLSAFDVWQERIREELPREQPIYVLCHHGIRSAQMAQWLCTQGFAQVVNIQGGIDAWARQVDPDVGVY